ncbi:MAG: hypothetical protein ACLS8T_34680 [Anaerobutyricum sp.]
MLEVNNLFHATRIEGWVIETTGRVRIWFGKCCYYRSVLSSGL